MIHTRLVKFRYTMASFLWTESIGSHVQRCMITSKSFSSMIARQEKLNQNLIHGLAVTMREQISSSSLCFSMGGSDERLTADFIPRVFLFGSSLSCTAMNDGDTDYAVLFVKRDENNALSESLASLGAVQQSRRNLRELLLLLTRRSQIELLNKFYCLLLYSVAQQNDCVTTDALKISSEKKNLPVDAPQDFHVTSSHFQRIFCARVPLIQFFPSYETRWTSMPSTHQTPSQTPSDAIEKSYSESIQSEQQKKVITGTDTCIIIKDAPWVQLDYKFDITLSPYGVLNSILLRYFVLAFPCLRPLLLVIKHWGKRQGIVNSRGGWLSSYALSIMLIEYLQTKGHVGFIQPFSNKLLDAVQCKILQSKQSSVCNCLVCNIERYVPFHEEEVGKDINALLKGFFHYYAYEIDFEDHVIDITRGGDLSQDIPSGNAKYHPLVHKSCFRAIVSSAARPLPGRHKKGITETFFTSEEEIEIKNQFMREAEKGLHKMDEHQDVYLGPQKRVTGEANDYFWHYLGYNLFKIKDPYESHSLGRSVEFFKAEAMKELFENFSRACEQADDAVKYTLEAESMLSKAI